MTKATMTIAFETSNPVLLWADIFDVLSVMVKRQKTEDDTWQPIRPASANVRAIQTDLRACWQVTPEPADT